MRDIFAKQLYIVFISLIVIASCFVAFSFFKGGFSGKVFETVAADTFDTTWAVKSDGIEDRKASIPGYEETAVGETLTLINRIPETVVDNTFLLIETGYQRVKLTLAGDVLLDNEGDRTKLSKEPFPAYYMVSIPVGAAGESISLSLTSSKKSESGKIGKIYYGSKGDVIMRLIGSNIFVSLFGALFIILAVILFFVKTLLSLPKNKRYELDYVIWLMGITGIFLLSDSSLMMLISGGRDMMFVAKLATVLLAPIAYVLYLKETVGKKKLLRFVDISFYILITDIIVAIVLSFLGIVEISIYTLIAECIAILIVLFLTFLLLVAAFGFKKKNLMYLGGSNIILFIFLLVELIIDKNEKWVSYKGLPLGLGLVIWMIMLALHTEARLVYGIKRERENYKYAEKNRKLMLLKSLTPDEIFTGFSSLLKMMKAGDKDAPRFLVKVSDYVRMRFNHIQFDEDRIVDFSEEQKGIEAMLDISMRKNKNFSYETEFKAADFKVPFGSVLAFVDNAVMHGTEGDKKIHISIKSYETDMGYVIQIADTGRGFLVEEIKSAGEYGILKSIDRLNSLLGAEVDIRSKEGAGTVVTIRLFSREKLSERKAQ